MWIKKLRSARLTRLLLLRVLIYLIVCLLLYQLLTYAAGAYMSRVITWDSFRAEVEAMVQSLRDYIAEHDLSIRDSDALAEWDKGNERLRVRIIARNSIVYETDSFDRVINWTRGDPFQLVGNLDYRNVTFRDGTAMVYIDTQSYLELQRTLTMVCLAVSVCVFLALVLLTLVQVVKDILRINEGVEVFEAGGLNYRIQVALPGELSQLADNLNHMSEELDRRIRADERAKDEQNKRVASFSHDVRTPLTMILGYTELLQTPDLPDERREEALRYLSEQAEMIRSITARAFSNATGLPDAVRYDFEHVDGDRYLRWLLGSIAANLGLNGFRCPPVESERREFGLNVDAVQMFRVGMNLAGNVLRYGDPAEPVELFAQVGAERVTITLRNRISEHPKPGGSGLGLRICRTILMAHGGDFRTQQEEGVFTCTLTLPVAEMPQAADPACSEAARPMK